MYNFMCIYNFAISLTGNLNIVLVLSDTSERKEHKLLKVYIPMSYQPRRSFFVKLRRNVSLWDFHCNEESLFFSPRISQIPSNKAVLFVR